MKIKHYLNSQFVVWLILSIITASGYIILTKTPEYLPAQIVNIAQTILFIATLYFIVKFASDITNTYLNDKFTLESDLASRNVQMAKMFLSIIFYAIALGAVFYKLGASLETITIYFGLFGTAIAFAFRDVFFSIIVWILLQSKIVITDGHFIDLGEKKGIIKDMGIFFTIVTPVDDNASQIIVPTKTLFDKPFSYYKIKRHKAAENYKIPLTKLDQTDMQNLQTAIKQIDDLPDIKVTHHKASFEANIWYIEISIVTTKANQEKLSVLSIITKYLTENNVNISQTSKTA